jgi:hypothetical protein
MRWLGLSLLAFVLGHSAALADDPISFKGKTITVVVTSSAGGGTDLSARVVAKYIAEHLPGKPTIVVRNVPGAQGIVGMNYFVRQGTPDGLTMTVAGSTLANPLLWRLPASQFNPTTFSFVGGSGRGGSVLLIRKDAEARLYDKSASPIIMGSLSGVPRPGSQAAAWGAALLNWNMKWVLGYPGTTELMFALERGEIDMVGTSNLFVVGTFVATGKFKILAQTGSILHGNLVPRPEFGDIPLMADLVKDKLADPLMRQAFEYWSSNTALDKWIAMPPNTPQEYVQAYRDAYHNAFNDPAFAEQGKQISDELEPIAYDDIEFLIKKLGATSPEAIAFISEMLRKQGLEAE